MGSRNEPVELASVHVFGTPQRGWCANGHEGLVRQTRFAPGEAPYLICDDCNGIDADGTEQRVMTSSQREPRGYEVPERFTSSFASQVDAATKRITGRSGVYNTSLARNNRYETMRERTPGFVRFLVPQHVDGKVRDRMDAMSTFAHEPWAGEAKYIANARGHFVFERPDAELLAKLRREHDEVMTGPVDEQLEKLQGAK